MAQKTPSAQDPLELEVHARVFQDHPIPTLILGCDMVVRAANQAFLARYAVPSQKVVGRRCYQVFHQIDEPCPRQRCRFPEALAGQRGHFNLHEYQDRHGQRIVEEVHMAPLTGPDGEVRAVIESIRDITETKRLESSLKESNEFLNRLLDSLVGVVVAADLNGDILFVNRSVTRVLGYEVDELVGENLRILSPISQLRELRQALDQHGGQALGVHTYVHDRQGNKIPVRVNAADVKRDGKPVATVGIFTDLREIQKMEGRLAQARMQVVQSDKLARLGRMAAGVAHELNNPLTGITVFAETAAESLPPGDPVRQDLECIMEDADRCRDIVRGLLDYSRQSEIRIEDLDLNRVVEDAFKLIRDDSVFLHVEVARHYHPEPLTIEGDEQLLRQVFINLLTNALDAMEGRGRLTVRTGLDDHGQRFVEISDTGPGIAAENIERVFDPFFTTKDIGKGTGLGLSVVYGLVTRHGGRIRVKETGPQGTTFQVTLPEHLQGTLAEFASKYEMSRTPEET